MPSPHRRAPRLRFLLLLALLVAGFLLLRLTPLGDLLTEEGTLALVEAVRRTWWAPLVLVGFCFVGAPLGLPMGPLLVAGAVFGPLRGALYNTAALLLGAASSFAVARVLGRDFVRRVAGRRLRRAEGFLQRRGFWPLVQTRFLPLPFPVVNFGAALAGVPAGLFLAASLVGLAPSTVVHTLFIATLFEVGGRQRVVVLAGYAAVFVLFNLLIGGRWVGRQS